MNLVDKKDHSESEEQKTRKKCGIVKHEIKNTNINYKSHINLLRT